MGVTTNPTGPWTVQPSHEPGQMVALTSRIQRRAVLDGLRNEYHHAA